MREYLLGIDVGTGSCKCCLMTADGKVTNKASRSYQPLIPKPGWSEQDPFTWYEAMIGCLKDFEQSAPALLKRVIAVGATGQMRGLTFIGFSGSVIRRSILWNDLRCGEEVRQVQREAAEFLRGITHNPLNTMCALPKLLWVIRHEPEVWHETHKLIFPKDYICFRLTGRLQTDLSDASGSLYYDIRQQKWSTDILKRYAISVEKLPDIHPATSVIGHLSPEAAQAMGLAVGIPVVAGGSDATVEMLALGIRSPAQCKLRLSTSGALSTVVDSLDRGIDTRLSIWSHLEPDRWMVDINTRSCAQSLEWLREILFAGKPPTAEIYRQMAQEAERVPVGAEGLLFHPYLMGEDAPYWDPTLKSSFWGLCAAHQRGHLIRAVLEGTAFALQDAYTVISPVLDGAVEYVFVGGGVQNHLWRQIVADVLALDGRTYPAADASRGAALLAGVGAGCFQDLDQAADCRQPEEQPICHNPENAGIYKRLFNKYKRLKRILDSAYEDSDRDDGRALANWTVGGQDG